MLYKLYAATVLIIAYPFIHLEEQLRELGRAYRNWKPKYTLGQTHEKWRRWWHLNVKAKE